MATDIVFNKKLDGILPNLSAWRAIFRLMDLDPNVYLFIKDRRKRFVWMNATLRKLLGAKDETDYLKKTDYDYSLNDLAFLFRQEDDKVFALRKEIINQPWVVSDKDGGVRWFVCSKIPLFSPGGKVIGLAGSMRNVSLEITNDPANEFRDIVEYILHHYHEKFRIEDLASMMYLSVSQFERKFSQVFHMAPRDFILKVRIDSSVRLLVDTDCSITEVALRCGFFDNSHFTRCFKKKMGMTPFEFRKRYSSAKSDFPVSSEPSMFSLEPAS